MKKILFVCTGNTCRSVMAEAFFNTMIKDANGIDDEYVAGSAGISLTDGANASDNTITVMEQDHGIDVSTHKAHTITKEDIEESFLILTLTYNHKEFLLARYPHAKDKVYTLGEYVENHGANSSSTKPDHRYDFPDPYGMSLEVYSQCASEIRKSVQKLIEILTN